MSLKPALYPHFIQWKVDLTAVSGFSQLVSKDKAKRILKGFDLLAKSQYKFAIETVDAKYLAKFLPLYKQHIQTREHGTVFDVQGTIEAKQLEGALYKSISLFEENVFIGGLIYNERPTTLSVAYRVYPHELKVKLPISISYLGEDILVKEALALGKKMIIHGRDRNPYGPYSAIGLAEYKLRIGGHPFVSKSKENTYQELEELKQRLQEDTLVFLGNTADQPITEAFLFTSLDESSARKKYASVLTQNAVQVTCVAGNQSSPPANHN